MLATDKPMTDLPHTEKPGTGIPTKFSVDLVIGLGENFQPIFFEQISPGNGQKLSYENTNILF